jgi:hypothetical protein
VSETTTETPAAEVPAEPTGEGTDHERLAKVESAVDQILGILRGGQTAPGAETPAEPADPRAEARAEMEKLKAAERRKQQRADEKARLEGRLSAIETAVKEKPPRDVRRATRIMKWANDDEA